MALTRSLVFHDCTQDFVIKGDASLYAKLPPHKSLFSCGPNKGLPSGNLLFFSEHGRPYAIAPVYDMTPMAFAPRRGGGLPDSLAAPTIHASGANETWRRAEVLARAFLIRVMAAREFSHRFTPCITALERHVEAASAKIGRLG